MKFKKMQIVEEELGDSNTIGNPGCLISLFVALGDSKLLLLFSLLVLDLLFKKVFQFYPATNSDIGVT